MKTAFRVGSLIMAAALVLAASWLWAENEEKKPASPRTRIGLINLNFVIKNHGKYKQLQEEIKKLAAPFQEREAELRSELKELQAKAQKEPDQRKELEGQFRDIQRKLQENGTKAQARLGKRNDEEMKIIYKQVEAAAERYAAAHDLDIVLHYNDASTKEDHDSAQNITRKLNVPALQPLYLASGIDITTEILTDLNQRNAADE
jgi:Skp family chaperone for outer membrane proteins